MMAMMAMVLRSLFGSRVAVMFQVPGFLWSHRDLEHSLTTTGDIASNNVSLKQSRSNSCSWFAMSCAWCSAGLTGLARVSRPQGKFGSEPTPPRVGQVGGPTGALREGIQPTGCAWQHMGTCRAGHLKPSAHDVVAGVWSGKGAQPTRGATNTRPPPPTLKREAGAGEPVASVRVAGGTREMSARLARTVHSAMAHLTQPEAPVAVGNNSPQASSPRNGHASKSQSWACRRRIQHPT